MQLGISNLQPGQFLLKKIFLPTIITQKGEEKIMRKNDLGAFDIFRMIAAALVIKIHTADIPFLGENGNLLLSGVTARIAVPFFFAATGFFTDLEDPAKVKKLLEKTILLYAAATAVYLPYGTYFASIKQVVFDGSFYHLWYFPALALGTVIVFFLKKLPTPAALTIASILYLFGLCGDSYILLAQKAEPLRRILDVLSNAFYYTRNGIFFAPLFLLTGNIIGNKVRGDEHRRRPKKLLICAFCFTISLMLLAVERFSLRGITYPPRDSMFISLMPCTVFLLLTLSSINMKPRPALRRISMWIYIIHPVFIDLTVRIKNSIDETGALNADARQVIRTALVSAVTAAAMEILLTIRKYPGNTHARS